MVVLGTTYCIGSIGPYIQSYFRVPASDTLMLFPSVVIMQTILMPVVSHYTKQVSFRILTSVCALVFIGCLYSCSLVARDNFKLFFLLYTGGYTTILAGTYMVPIQLGWTINKAWRGLITGIIVGGFGIGPLIFNSVSTKVMNPDNTVGHLISRDPV